MSLKVLKAARFKSRKRGQKYKTKNWNHTTPTPCGPYARPEIRQVLAIKSIRCFGSRWKWYRLAGKLGLTIAGIEKQMDAIILYQEKQIERLREQTSIKTSDTNRTNRNPNDNNNESDRLKDGTTEHFTIEGKEIRSKQTDDEPTSSGSDK